MLPYNSSQDQLTDSIVTINIPLRRMSCPPHRKYTGSSLTMDSRDSGLSQGSHLNRIRVDELDDYRNNNNNEDKDQKAGHSFRLPAVDFLMGCCSFTRDICLSYYKWFLFICYNVYWILGILRTWHKVRPSLCRVVMID